MLRYHSGCICFLRHADEWAFGSVGITDCRNGRWGFDTLRDGGWMVSAI